MKLEDLRQERKGVRPVWTHSLEAGDSKYELALSGPTATVKKMFADAEFEVRIDPAGTEKTFDKERQSVMRDEKPSSNLSVSEMEAGFAKKPPAPTLAKSVFMSLCRTEGRGTFFFFTFGGFVMPGKVSFFLSFPPGVLCQAIVKPLTGDQDLRLWNNWPPFLGPVASSTKGGTATDVVTGGPFPFGPMVELAGWTTGTCGAFTVLTV